MKILQLPERGIDIKWQYSYSIFQDENNGTEINPMLKKKDRCFKVIHSPDQTVLDYWKQRYRAKEVYVSTNGQGTERD